MGIEIAVEEEDDPLAEVPLIDVEDPDLAEIQDYPRRRSARRRHPGRGPGHRRPGEACT